MLLLEVRNDMNPALQKRNQNIQKWKQSEVSNETKRQSVTPNKDMVGEESEVSEVHNNITCK